MTELDKTREEIENQSQRIEAYVQEIKYLQYKIRNMKTQIRAKNVNKRRLKVLRSKALEKLSSLLPVPKGNGLRRAKRITPKNP